VRVSGEIPVDLAWGRPRRDLSGAPVALTATATHLDLTIVESLFPRTVESATGRLSFDLRAEGPWRAPRVVGELGIDEGSLELTAVGIPYEKIHARISANGTRLEVRALHAEAGDGTADVTGSVDLPVGGPGGADLALQLNRFFAVRREAYEAAVSGTLTARGPLAAPELTGNLDVDRALVRPSGLPASEPTVARDTTIEVVGAPTPFEDTLAPGPATALAEPLRLALTVTIARNAWIRRDDADIEIAGELKVTKAPQQPVRITGQIRLVRGWYMFKGRRFTLQEGTITFAGSAPPAPTFDLTAVHRAGEYEIEVHITGSADKPTLTLSSTPPLEQADILSVLLFGKATQQLGRGQSADLQDQALQLAAGYVVPELRTSVMNALGVDTLEVELPQGAEQTGRVSAGRYVADDVFLSLAQELGPRAAQEVGIEYEVGANVSVRGSTTTRGTSAIDLFWRYRY
jgi:translocation and assembly module TamB